MNAIAITKEPIGKMLPLVAAGLLWAAGATLSCRAGATEIVYVPVNPNFGGSPLNAPGLLGTAQATNKHPDPNAPSQDPLHQFNDMLERSILSRLSYAATANLFGSSNQLVPGTVETGNFRIDIVDMGNGVLKITTTDKVTGASTSFEVGQ